MRRTEARRPANSRPSWPLASWRPSACLRLPWAAWLQEMEVAYSCKQRARWSQSGASARHRVIRGRREVRRRSSEPPERSNKPGCTAAAAQVASLLWRAGQHRNQLPEDTSRCTRKWAVKRRNDSYRRPSDGGHGAQSGSSPYFGSEEVSLVRGSQLSGQWGLGSALDWLHCSALAEARVSQRPGPRLHIES